MSDSALVLVLHAHLPWVRHAEHDDFAEERWLFEALGECYLPLAARLTALAGEGVPYRLSMSVTAPLVSMLDDPLLRARFLRWRARLERVALRELARARAEGRGADAVALAHAARKAREMRAAWDAIGGDLPGALAALEARGHLELLACAATHAFLPGFAQAPRVVAMQLGLGARAHALAFGRPARAAWLPECGYFPGLDVACRRAGVGATVLDAHGLLHATPRPPHGRLAPARTEAGLAVVARDPGSAEQVWSLSGGYPGDPRYRDFHHDGAQELAPELLDDVQPDGLAALRFPVGLKTRRVTSHDPRAPKESYDPERAAEAVQEHAAHFVSSCEERLARAEAAVGPRAALVAAYDAELFGHWWHEGPDFLEAVLRRAAPRTRTLSEVAHRDASAAVVRPRTSTWGEGGYARVWVDDGSAAWWRVLHAQASRLPELVARHRGTDDPLVLRALAQLVREALLAQASDWPFLVTKGGAADYARGRFGAHVEAFEELAGRLDAGPASVRAALAWLSGLESRDGVLARVPARAVIDHAA